MRSQSDTKPVNAGAETDTQDWPSQGLAPCSPHHPEGLWAFRNPCFSGLVMKAKAQSALEMASLELTTHRPLHTSLVKPHSTFHGPDTPSLATRWAGVSKGPLGSSPTFVARQGQEAFLRHKLAPVEGTELSPILSQDSPHTCA